jgi:hypothetical protein
MLAQRGFCEQAETVAEELAEPASPNAADTDTTAVITARDVRRRSFIPILSLSLITAALPRDNRPRRQPRPLVASAAGAV